MATSLIIRPLSGSSGRLFRVVARNSVLAPGRVSTSFLEAGQVTGIRV